MRSTAEHGSAVLSNRAGQTRIAAGVGWGVAVLGGAVLAVWLVAGGPLHPPGGRTAAMNPSTGLGFLMAGLSLALARPGSPSWRWARASSALALAVVLLGLLRIAEYLSLFAAGVDTWFASLAAVDAARARMGATTAVAFLLAGSGLVIFDRASTRAQFVANVSLLGTGGLGLVGLIAHAYGAPALHGRMAVGTAATFVVLSAAALAADPSRGLVALLRSDGPGGVAARRLLPAVAAALVAFGGLFVGLARSGRIDGEVAVALVVIAGLATLVAAVGAVSFTLDRAEIARRRVEQELRDSEARYRLFFDLVPLPTWVFDRETLSFLAVNEAAMSSYGYTRDEFLAMNLGDIRPAEDLQKLHRHVAAVDGESDSRGFWRHRKRDETVIDVEIIAAPVTFDERPARIVVARDVTEERRMTAALAASEERFRALAETATDAIVSADAHGDITYLNPAAERLFGLEAKGVAGRPITVLMPERFHEAHRRGLERFLRTGEARVIGRTVELEGRSADGREFPVELSLATWKEGDQRAFTAVLRDITRRKQAEEDLRRNAAELAAANAELDAFSYSVSHDLRAPLRSIDGFSQALLEDCADRLDETGRSHLGRVRAAAQRMAALIDDLLELARVSRSEMRRESVDLGAVARTILDELHRCDPERKVEVVIGEDLVAEGDPRLLHVALENLLGNAWKYTRPKEQACVELTREALDGAAVFRVRDNGVGFDMRYAENLFAPFQRLHRVDEFEGTGIGLATVRRIVRRHGGRIWAEAEVGRGAAFYFTL